MITLSSSLNTLSDTNLVKLEFQRKIDEIIEKGKRERWFISCDELIYQKKPFASGSFSSVHKCTWRSIEIALKIPIETSQDTILSCLKEVEIWSTLRHPNLVQFLGVSIIEGKLCIMMEKIDGENLKQYLMRRRTKLTNKERWNLAYQICVAISFLHNCTPSIIYRDLKPENIMITENNKIKLTDFGLSRFMPEDTNFIMTGGTGTLRYLSPEVYHNKKYDLKSDIYSLGWVLYFIFSNKIPFSNFNISSMNSCLMNKDYTNKVVKEHLNNIPDNRIHFIILMCVRYDAIERFEIEDICKSMENLKSKNENDRQKNIFNSFISNFKSKIFNKTITPCAPCAPCAPCTP
tara:strand:+ start:3539 stop:4582 length:1044 start_codon:yes stop_codon:yes gene_type:complete